MAARLPGLSDSKAQKGMRKVAKVETIADILGDRARRLTRGTQRHGRPGMDEVAWRATDFVSNFICGSGDKTKLHAGAGPTVTFLENNVDYPFR
jgi:hypothetical protein